MSGLALAVWLAVAWADDLRVEQAKRALAEERSADAYALAIDALARGPADGDAWRVYLRAADAAGLADPARAEVAVAGERDDDARVVLAWWDAVHDGGDLGAIEALAPTAGDEARVALAWATARTGDPALARARLPASGDPMATRLAIRLDRELGDDDDAAARARRWLDERPDRPDVLDELWPGEADGDLARARRHAVRSIRRGLRGDADPVWLYRALRLAIAADADDEAAVLADRIAARGSPRPLDRGRWSPPMREALGRTLALSSEPELPPATPAELADVVGALARHALDRDRPDVAARALMDLVEASPTFEAARELAGLRIALEQWAEAADAVEILVDRATRPAADDLGRLDLARHRRELATALGHRAELAMAERRGEDAATDAWIARLLDGHPQWGALWMGANAALGPIGARVGGEALRRAEEALADGRIVEATALATERLRSAARVDADGAAGTAEDAVAALILRARATGSVTDVTIASLLAADDAEVWALRAELQEARGWREAAFASFAIARRLGADRPGALERVYEGPGAVEAAADAIAAPVVDGSAEVVAPEVREEPRRIEVGGALGRPMPAWTAATLDGQPLGADALRGRVYVLSLWASWCAPCMVELPAIARVVAGLRADGVPVEAVAISVDEQQKIARRTAAREGWAGLTVGWAPDLVGQLGVSGLPTTWVVAADGTVVHHQLGYDGDFDGRLARILREAAAD